MYIVIITNNGPLVLSSRDKGAFISSRSLVSMITFNQGANVDKLYILGYGMNMPLSILSRSNFDFSKIISTKSIPAFHITSDKGKRSLCS